jgi:hypothetical protein
MIILIQGARIPDGASHYEKWEARFPQVHSLARKLSLVLLLVLLPQLRQLRLAAAAVVVAVWLRLRFFTTLALASVKLCQGIQRHTNTHTA